MRFFEVCERYQQEVKENVTARAEPKAFWDTHGAALAKHVGDRIGAALTPSDVWSMWLACASEFSLLGDGKWCNVFTKSEAEICEFRSDLDLFFKSSYAHRINYEIASVLLNEIVAVMKEIVDDEQTHTPKLHNLKANLYFGHAETVVPLQALLGVSMPKRHPNRNWTFDEIKAKDWDSSVVSPYSSNAKFVLFKCPSAGQSCDDDDFRVHLSINEQEHMLAGCGEMYCPFSKFYDSIEEPVTLNWDGICDVPSNASATAAPAESKSNLPYVLLGVMFVLRIVMSRFRRNNPQ